jgi:hypothetical protein
MEPPDGKPDNKQNNQRAGDCDAQEVVEKRSLHTERFDVRVFGKAQSQSDYAQEYYEDRGFKNAMADIFFIAV